MTETITTAESLSFVMAIIFLFVYLLLFGFVIAQYVLQSLAFHTLARRRGIANPWLSWLPLGNYWIIGSLARDYDKQNKIQRRWDKTLLILSIVFVALYVFVYIGMIFGITITALNIDAATMPEEVAFSIFFGIILAFIPIMLIAAALQTITYICHFKIFESTVPEKALKYFLLSILVPFAQPICLFLCRNKGYQHPDPLAYIYAPVNKNYSYYQTNTVNTIVEATEPQTKESEEFASDEPTTTEE